MTDLAKLANLLADNPRARQIVADFQDDFYFNFRPRPDQPARYDEQESFVRDRVPGVAGLLGGNACLGGEQEIYDPVAGISRRVDRTTAPFWVHSLGTSGMEISRSSTPFVKGVARLFRIHLSSGESFVSTLSHAVLCPDVGWREVGKLAVGDQLLLPRIASNSGLSAAFRSVSSRGGRHLLKTPAGDQSDSSIGGRLCATSRVLRSAAPTTAGAFAGQHAACDPCSVTCREWSLKCERRSFRRRSDSLESCWLDLHRHDERLPLVRDIYRDALRRLPGNGGNVSDATHITAIEYLRTGEFYDLHVPGNNNYRCAGVIHHNSGTSEAAAYKLSQFVMNQQAPPRQDTPFWIVGPKIDQTIKTFWKEKIFGHGHIPSVEIDWRRIRWHSEKQALPSSVPLLPWPRERGGSPKRNWCLEFRSFAEGTAHLTAESIGGFCLTEPFPHEILVEILRATREYDYPGSRFFELTPVDPALTYWLEEMILEDKVPAGWKFYRCNLECNVEDPNSVVGNRWADDFLATVSAEMQPTRTTGAFASYEGVIYQSFNRAVHVVDNMPVPMSGVFHKRAIDWGASDEHPLAVVWAYKDPLGVWNIYEEYYTTDQSKLWADHCEAIIALRPWPLDNPAFRQTYGDPSRPDLMREFSSHGIPVTSARNEVHPGIESVRRCLKTQPQIGPRLRVASHCKQTIKEFLIYRWEQSTGKGVNPRVAKPQPLKKWDDCMDAVRYLIHTDYRANVGGQVRGYRTEPRPRPQVRHRRVRR